MIFRKCNPVDMNINPKWIQTDDLQPFKSPICDIVSKSISIDVVSNLRQLLDVFILD